MSPILSNGPYNLKVILIGDGFVGKTSLRRQYMGHKFESQYLETLGADFAIKTTMYNNEVQFRFQIWDLAGQPRFSQLRKSFYLGGQVALLVFDVTNRKSFDSVYQWAEEFWTNNGNGILPIILIGNKIDLRPSFEDSLLLEDGEEIAIELSRKAPFKIPYIETSAKTGKNVNEAFETLAQLFIDFHNMLR